jgi:trans-feruloyl-CoA hydratase/vanillin synthase
MSTPANGKPVPGGENVLVEFEDGIAWVSLNRPEKRNAMSVALAYEMLEVLEALEIDDRAGVLVLTGTGEAFSAGMDLKDYFRATDGMPTLERLRIYRTNAMWQWRLLAPYPKPTIAMVNGWCFGGAFTPLISCDLAIAAEEATFGLSEINWGIIPAGIVTKAVAQVMNQRDCLYYIMTGETFDGKRAKEMGLVNDAVPKDQLRERVRKLARTLLEKNPVVLSAAKQAYKQVRDMTWENAADYLGSKMDQVSFLDKENGRAQGMKQFLDDKSFKPGLGAYKKN